MSDLIPSSLESDYEEVKVEARRKILKDNRSSQSIGVIGSDIRDETYRNQFDFKIWSSLKKDKNLIQNRWSGSDVLAYSLTSMEKAQRTVELLNLIRVWPKRSKDCCWSNFYLVSAKTKRFINS